MKRALRRSRYSAPEIEAAIGRLREQRALDDERYASSFARSRLSYHGVGRNRIRAALQQKGVPRDAAEKGLKEALAEHPESQALEAAARRLLRQHAKDEPKRRLAKAFQALLRRGFPASLVRQRLSVLQPGYRDMLEDYEVAASEAVTEPGPEND